MSIKEISDILLSANEPEDVFTGSTKEEIKKEYRRLAKICHPDIAPQNEKELAEKTTILLNEFYEKANKKLEEGIYGIKDPKELYKKKQPIFSFDHRGNHYDIYQAIKEEDVSTIYEGLSNTAPKAWERLYPSSPPSFIEPGTSGATWLDVPPG